MESGHNPFPQGPSDVYQHWTASDVYFTWVGSSDIDREASERLLKYSGKIFACAKKACSPQSSEVSGDCWPLVHGGPKGLIVFYSLDLDLFSLWYAIHWVFKIIRISHRCHFYWDSFFSSCISHPCQQVSILVLFSPSECVVKSLFIILNQK